MKLALGISWRSYFALMFALAWIPLIAGALSQ